MISTHRCTYVHGHLQVHTHPQHKHMSEEREAEVGPQELRVQDGSRMQGTIKEAEDGKVWQGPGRVVGVTGEWQDMAGSIRVWWGCGRVAGKVRKLR